MPPTAQLIESLPDARLLLQHAANKGRVIDNTIVGAILAADGSAGSVTPQVEEAFWVKFSELSASLQPATVEGIRETRPHNFTWLGELLDLLKGKRPSIPAAYTSVGGYGFLAIVFLTIVVGQQIFTSYGSAMLENVAKLQAESIAIDKDPSSDADKELRHRANDQSALANLDLLRSFNNRTNWWFNKETVDDAPRVIERAKLVLTWMNGFLLPICVGALGATAQILRSLAEQIRCDSYSSEARIQFRVRLALGVLAGAAVGLVFVANTPGGSASAAHFGVGVGPLALPFLAGYSIEFFFNILDRIIASFK